MTQVISTRMIEELPGEHVRAFAAGLTQRSEALLKRASQLEKGDQMLIELAVRGQLSHRRIAALVSLPHGTVTRRLRRLGTLLHDPLVIRLLDGPCPLERTDRQIAIGYFLHRRPLRELATLHRQSLPQISRRLQFVRGWFRGASLRRNAE